MFGHLASLVLAAAISPSVPAVACPDAEAPVPSPVGRPRYALVMRVSSGLRHVTGTMTVSFTPERPTDRLVFRLWPNSPFLARRGARLTVGPILSRGRRLPTSRPNATTLVVQRRLAAGERIVVSTTWQLRLSGASHARLAGGTVARLASFFPLLAWNPREGWQLGPPSAIGWETWTSPTADFDARVTAPRGVQVFASGDRMAASRWRARAVRDFAVAVGRFAIVRGTASAPGPVRVTVAVDRGRPAAARRLFATVREALEAHSRRFGAYPWTTFTAVASDLDRFSFEYPTLVFLSTTDPQAQQSAAHEVGHQWFYSLVGNNQARDPWLDETLATWAEVRFSDRLAQVAALTIPEPVRNQLGQPMTFWDRFEIPVFIDGAYNQGVQALASLGDPEAVDCALRLYTVQNAYGIANPDDLLRALRVFFPDARQKLEALGAQFGP